eukprot:3678474-Amphidinium_carterae.1
MAMASSCQTSCCRRVLAALPPTPCRPLPSTKHMARQIHSMQQLTHLLVCKQALAVHLLNALRNQRLMQELHLALATPIKSNWHYGGLNKTSATSVAPPSWLGAH